MNKRKKYSKKAIECLMQMSQANMPTREQFIAA